MALQPELTRCGEQATWCWLVDEIHACLERVTMERAASVAPRAGSAVWRTACLAVSARQKAARKALDSDLVVEEDDDVGGLEVDADIAAARVFGVATLLSQKGCETCRCVAVRLALKLAAWDALPDDYAPRLWRLIRLWRRTAPTAERRVAAPTTSISESTTTTEALRRGKSRPQGALPRAGRAARRATYQRVDGPRVVVQQRRLRVLGLGPVGLVVPGLGVRRATVSETRPACLSSRRKAGSGFAVVAHRIARLVARENGFAGPLARAHEWRLVAPLAARLLSRHAQSEAGAAAAGAQLLRCARRGEPS